MSKNVLFFRPVGVMFSLSLLVWSIPSSLAMDRAKQIQNDLEIMETIIKEARECSKPISSLFGYVSQKDKEERLEKAKRLSRRIEHQLLPELLTPSEPGIPGKCDMRSIALKISKSVLSEALNIQKDGIGLDSTANLYTYNRFLSVTHYFQNVRPKLLKELELILSSPGRVRDRAIEDGIR